jgi:hypothetical protein
MERKLIALLAAALSSCATRDTENAAEPWSECAKAQLVSWLESGIPSSWPVAETLPEGRSVQVVSLGAYPPGAIHDALYRTLHLLPSISSAYVEQTGGIAGVRQLYGPISLIGHCGVHSPGAL